MSLLAMIRERDAAEREFVAAVHGLTTSGAVVSQPELGDGPRVARVGALTRRGREMQRERAGRR